MRVRIVTEKVDGSALPRVKFFDVENDDKEIMGVFNCDISLMVADIPRATLQFWAEAAVEAEAKLEHVCPHCKQVVPEPAPDSKSDKP